MGAQLFSRRARLSILERLLFALALTMVGWHGSNFLITIVGLFRFDPAQWSTFLRIADSIAVVSITFAYSFLLHVHLHLWAHANGRSLTRTEKIRVYLSYLPTLFLTITLWKIWIGPYAPMFTKVKFFVFPFALWVGHALGLIAVTELLIARKTPNRSEQRIMRTLAVSFVGIGILIFAALALGLGEGTTPGLYLQTIADLGSAPSVRSPGLLHLPLSLPRVDYREESHRCHFCCSCTHHLHLRHSHNRRLDDFTIRSQARRC